MAKLTPTKTKSNAGRPTIYSEELIERICEQISNGKSLRAVCRAKDMPSMSTVMVWLGENDKFSEQYRKATEQREDFHFEEMMEIADKVLPESAEVAKAKLQIDTRKWVLSRMNPKKYGDKQQMEHSGDVAVNMISELMKELSVGE